MAWMSLKDAAKQLDVTAAHLGTLARYGQIQAQKDVSGDWRVDTEVVAVYLENHGGNKRADRRKWRKVAMTDAEFEQAKHGTLGADWQDAYKRKAADDNA